jgi:hypothetical protein
MALLGIYSLLLTHEATLPSENVAWGNEYGLLMLSIDLCEEYNDIVGDTGHSRGHPGDIVGHLILTPGCYGT